jgi:hypothetical protein
MRYADSFVTCREENVTFVNFELARSQRDSQAPEFGQDDILDKVPEHIRRAVAAEVTARFITANIDMADTEQTTEQLALKEALTSESIDLDPYECVLVQHLAATEYSALSKMAADHPN